MHQSCVTDDEKVGLLILPVYAGTLSAIPNGDKGCDLERKMKLNGPGRLKLNRGKFLVKAKYAWL